MSLDILHNSLYTPLISSANMNANISASTPVQGITVFSVQAFWTGFNADTAARITTSASNDGVNWTQIDSIAPTGTANSYMLNVEKCGYRFAQVAYTQTAGAGTLGVTISGKII